MAEHSGYSDLDLLRYLRDQASECQLTPLERDVVGGVCIRKRFGSWSTAVFMAGLSYRRKIGEPKLSSVNHYLKIHGYDRMTEEAFAERKALCRDNRNCAIYSVLLGKDDSDSR